MIREYADFNEIHDRDPYPGRGRLLREESEDHERFPVFEHRDESGDHPEHHVGTKERRTHRDEEGTGRNHDDEKAGRDLVLRYL